MHGITEETGEASADCHMPTLPHSFKSCPRESEREGVSRDDDQCIALLGKLRKSCLRGAKECPGTLSDHCMLHTSS